MIIDNEFSVGAAIDDVWRHLLDMEGVASCLPGATIQATDQENVFDGSMRLKIGPMRVEYRGTATLTDVDEESHTAVIALSAREAKGQGTAMATIRNHLDSTADATRVRSQTDLQISGPQAQFGRGVIEDVGKRVLAEFAQRLEQRIGTPDDDLPSTVPDGGKPSAPAAESPWGERPQPSTAADEFDLGRLISRTAAVRGGAVAAALLAALAILVRRRR